MSNTITSEQGLKALANISETTGKTPAEIEKEMEVTIHAELVSTIRLMRHFAEAGDHEAGARILGVIRKMERSGDDSVEAQMSQVILDTYFKARGNWSKMEQLITDAARAHSVEISPTVIDDLFAKKLVRAKAVLVQK